jgi:hypothetical protein
MKSMKRLLVLVMVAILLGASAAPVSAQRIIYVVCQWFSAEKNCYKCSDYFSVRSEAQAQKRCRSGTPFYFPSVGALQGWMIGNCTCDHD